MKRGVDMGINELYEGFKTKFNAVSGECYRVKSIDEVAPQLIKVLQEKNAKTISLYENLLSKEANLLEAFN
jgi:L-lactate dehydrogenase complex protein LldG